MHLLPHGIRYPWSFTISFALFINKVMHVLREDFCLSPKVLWLASGHRGCLVYFFIKVNNLIKYQGTHMLSDGFLSDVSEILLTKQIH